MASLFYDMQKQKDRFELSMNRQEAKELLLACRRWNAEPYSTLNSVAEELQQFFNDEAQARKPAT